MFCVLHCPRNPARTRSESIPLRELEKSLLPSIVLPFEPRKGHVVQHSLRPGIMGPLSLPWRVLRLHCFRSQAGSHERAGDVTQALAVDAMLLTGRARPRTGPVPDPTGGGGFMYCSGPLALYRSDSLAVRVPPPPLRVSSCSRRHSLPTAEAPAVLGRGKNSLRTRAAQQALGARHHHHDVKNQKGASSYHPDPPSPGPLSPRPTSPHVASFHPPPAGTRGVAHRPSGQDAGGHPPPRRDPVRRERVGRHRPVVLHHGGEDLRAHGPRTHGRVSPG